jgi:hypothetical protein
MRARQCSGYERALLVTTTKVSFAGWLQRGPERDVARVDDHRAGTNEWCRELLPFGMYGWIVGAGTITVKPRQSAVDRRGQLKYPFSQLRDPT